jgi:hypothetical protein
MICIFSSSHTFFQNPFIPHAFDHNRGFLDRDLVQQKTTHPKGFLSRCVNRNLYSRFLLWNDPTKLALLIR